MRLPGVRKQSSSERGLLGTLLPSFLTLFAVCPLLAQTAASPTTPRTPDPTAPNAAQTLDQTQSPAGQAGTSIRGSVADPDNAVIPGATVTLTPSSGNAIIATSGPDGSYALRAVPPGVYSLTITMPGFASYVRQGMRITATPLVINAKLAIQNEETTVTVTASQSTVSVDPDNNASATVLTGKDLDALSDDPDELSDQLTALAGPAAGPNGGQIYIDGFTGGQLPSKSSIREIRINQNPFSAEYDKAGFGRVEIFTKPGTDKFHGSAQLNGFDKSFNTGSPFIGDTPQPDYHTVFFFGSLTGPINKNASFAMNGSYRDIQNNAIVNPPAIYAESQTSGVPCNPGQAGCSIFQTSSGNGYTFAQFVPQTRWDISPRLDVALSSKNTLTARFQYEHNDQQNQGIGNLDLPDQGYISDASETTLQVSDSQVFSTKVINETRFEYQRPVATITPVSVAPTITVQGAFTGGGSSAGSSNDIQNHIEVQNYTSIGLAKNFIRFGGRLRTTSDNNTSNSNANGTFTYTSIQNYQNNVLADYNVTAIPVPTVSTRTTDLGLYAEDDWKVRPNFTFSYGIRYETQNFIHDHRDFAPRLSASYGLGKKTVLRAGAGLFYDRFLLPNQLATVRNNGLNQQQYTVSSDNSNGTTLPATCTPADPAACPISATGRLTIQNIASRLRAPYTMQENLGLDQQLTRAATLSVNYQHIKGVHQFNSDVPNFDIASTTDPLQYQYQSEGFFNQNQLIANVNYRGSHGSLFGFYVLNFAKSDTGGVASFASVPNDLRADYGRATFDIRNRVFLGGSFNLPFLVTLSPFLVANSGTPYNITSGLDEYGDNIFNSRAVFAPAGTVSTVPNGTVKSINGCGTFATPGTAGATGAVPINYCTGPANFTVNLRIVKTFGFGAALTKSTQDQGGSGGPGGPRGPGGPGGGRGGSGGGGSRWLRRKIGQQRPSLQSLHRTSRPKHLQRCGPHHACGNSDLTQLWNQHPARRQLLHHRLRRPPDRSASLIFLLAGRPQNRPRLPEETVGLRAGKPGFLATDKVRSGQPPGRVPAINHQLRLTHNPGIVVVRVVCDDENTVVLAKIVKRGRGHVEVVMPSAANLGMIWIVIKHFSTIGTQKFDDGERGRLAQIVNVFLIAHTKHQDL